MPQCRPIIKAVMGVPQSKKGVLLYLDTLPAIQMLPDEQAGILLKQILTYATTGVDKQMDNPATCMCWAFIKQQLDRDATKYQQICQKRKVAGSKGGQQRVANQANASTCYQMQANANKPKQVQANQANINRDRNSDRDRDNNDGLMYIADVPRKPDAGSNFAANGEGVLF